MTKGLNVRLERLERVRSGLLCFLARSGETASSAVARYRAENSDAPAVLVPMNETDARL